MIFGGAEENRTPNLFAASEMLYQLSYSPVFINKVMICKAKKSDGVKVKNLRHITKLVDANKAGTDKSKDCTLILCEGDSAKAGIISGLSKEDREWIGVYPMKGKLFNVRGEKDLKISENKEICDIKQILGLELGMEYTKDLVYKKLRYGKILFMTDQDLDGSHIKGLGINLFHYQWPSLIKIDKFIGFVNTPILKARNLLLIQAQ